MDKVDIRKARQEGEVLYAHNTTNRIITANDSESRFELGPHGSMTSTRPIPYSKLDMPGVIRLIRRGDIVIGLDDDFTDELDVEESPLDHAKDFNVVIEDDKTKNDLVEKTCLITGEKVFQTLEEVRNDVPPLHESVKHLSGQFAVRHVQKEGEPGHEVVWDRVEIG